MDYTRYQLEAGLWFDARKAVWFSSHRVLAVADLHIGYAWVQRMRGQLLPIGNPTESMDRLFELIRFYEPRELVLLGDIVHRAVNLPAIRLELEGVCNKLGALVRLTCVVGNHDKQLAGLFEECGIRQSLQTCSRVGRHLLIHGDTFNGDGAESRKLIEETPGHIFMGHEHPAIRLSDGISSSGKFPCFLIGQKTVVLPAFSAWAAGSVIGNSPWMSDIAKADVFTRAIAVLGNKLLPVSLNRIHSISKEEIAQQIFLQDEE